MAYPGRREPRNKNKGGVHVAKAPKYKGKRFRGRGQKGQMRLLKNDVGRHKESTPHSEPTAL